MALRLPVTYQKKPCYDIVFGKTFDELKEEMISLGVSGRKLCIITDSNVKPLYAETVKSLLEEIGEKICIYTIDAGEESKTLDTVKDIYKYLIMEGFGRKDVLIALGGGVVGDVTGYTAATYMRGIGFVQIPTTLLAQCDSSIGGKTGVDFDGYKNMIGAFKMPLMVYINPEVLKTLSDRQYFSGFAEVMKHGLIKDAAFYEWLIMNMYEICEKDADILEEMIMRSLEIKKAVVEKDPFEEGDRALLNFGHTIGHAIEKEKAFTLYHGECVALGSVAAAYISYKKGILPMEEYYEVRDMFVPFYLPISVEGIDPDRVVAFTGSDKKAENGKLKFVLLKKIGKAFVDTEVTKEEILEAVNEIYFSEEDAHE